MTVSCGSNSAPVASEEFTDAVQEALSADGHINLDHLQWTRDAASFKILGDTVSVTTAPHTDLWQRTYYHFRNDNAPVFQMKTREQYFSFVVKTDFTQSHQRFDQCGVVMYLDSDNWLKGSVEYENADFQHLGSVATNNGYSDWATTAIPADVKTMWYRFPAGRMIIASNVPGTVSTSARCVSVTCMPVRERSPSASMPALRKSLPSRRSLRT